jgi:hypothetical protein
MSKTNRNLPFLYACLLLALLLVAPVGCTANEDGSVTSDAELVAKVRADKANLEAKLAEANAVIASLPPGNPVRAQYEQAVPKITAALQLAEELIKSTEQGTPTPALMGAFTAIPGVTLNVCAILRGA